MPETPMHTFRVLPVQSHVGVLPYVDIAAHHFEADDFGRLKLICDGVAVATFAPHQWVGVTRLWDAGQVLPAPMLRVYLCEGVARFQTQDLCAQGYEVDDFGRLRIDSQALYAPRMWSGVARLPQDPEAGGVVGPPALIA